MKTNPSIASEILVNARRALQQGDRQTARRLAEQAASQAPEMEEPWLILASLANPQTSIDYLKKALTVNPHSKMARKGMHWAITRLRNQPSQSPGTSLPKMAETNKPVPAQPRIDLPAKKIVVEPAYTIRPQIQPESHGSNKKMNSRRLFVLPGLLLVACMLAVVWAIWPGNVSPALAFLRANTKRAQETQSLPAAPGGILKPTYTATFTPTYTPSPTYTPTPTYTLTPSPTQTPLPTSTFIPTNTPYPTQTPNPVPGSGGERWIDVDLSQQMVYAYEGSTLVNSFLVSTGTWLHPTVTGQFNIYIKLRYTDMAGPGYYLPNVPYTMYFFSGYALHGTYWHSNFGTPMSHGCINLSTPDAGWLFDWASVGTLVNIHY